MDLKQIIRLHLEGFSNRRIAETLGINRNTVNDHLRLFGATGVPLEKLLDQSADEIQSLFPARSTIVNKRYDALMAFLETFRDSRSHPGFNLLHHYEEYRLRHENPYGYTQFTTHYHSKYGTEKGAMKLAHTAGDKLFVDFAGQKLAIVDRNTGESIPVEVFVAILPCSQYIYARACKSQQRGDFLNCLVQALEYFGGVPQAIVSDNLKTAVSRASKYEPLINRSLKEMACHYGCVINPTRVYAPQDKALVEKAVHLLYQRVYYPIRKMIFFSLEELNREIMRRLGEYNALLLQRRQVSRKELFQSLERPYLRPLPSEPYELRDYVRSKVQKMGYVYFSPDKHYYSVPYRYIGHKTQIQYTMSRVEVYSNRERIACHVRNPAPGLYSTIKKHLMSAHQVYLDWSPEYFQQLAQKQGPFVARLIQAMFSRGEYPELVYKKAMGIIQLHRAYGAERLNEACRRVYEAAQGGGYRMVRNVLIKGLDKIPSELELLNNTTSHIPRHINIRGPECYQ